MGWFDVISKGVTALVREFCFTFVHNSNIRALMGIAGGGETQAAPVFIAREKCLITQLKIDTRITGARSGGIDELQVNYDYNRVQNQEGPINIAELPEQEFSDPTYRQVTLNGIAFVVVRNSPSDLNPSYTIPAVHFKFEQLTDLITVSNQVPEANAFTDPTKVLWSTIRQLAGVDTYREVRGGFVNAKFPGPIRLNKGDYIQLIWFGSDNFVFPQNSFNGIYGRYCGLISWEYEPESASTDQNSERDNTLDGPSFRKFAAD